MDPSDNLGNGDLHLGKKTPDSDRSTKKRNDDRVECLAKKHLDKHIFTEKCAKTKPSTLSVTSIYLVDKLETPPSGEAVPRTH